MNFKQIFVNNNHHLIELVNTFKIDYGLSRQREILQNRGFGIMLIDADTMRFCGMACFLVSSMFKDLTFEFCGAFVAPEYRNKGVYRELVKARLAFCKSFAGSLKTKEFNIVAATRHGILMKDGWEVCGKVGESTLYVKHVKQSS